MPVGDSNWGDLDPATVEKLKSHIQRSVADGVAEGLRSVAEDEDLFDLLAARVTSAFRRSAAKASGEFLIDSAKGLARRAFTFIVLGVLVYSMGGWAGLVALWKAMTAHGGPNG